MKTTNTTAHGMAHAAAIAGLMVFGAMIANAGLVTVTNVTAQQRFDAPLVDITYDLLNPSGGAHTVTIDVSTNGGAAYFSTCTNFTGDVGADVAVGTGKQITWNAMQDTLPTNKYANTRVRVTAYAYENYDMVLIPAGSFTMGDTFSEGDSYEQPTHSVYVSAFYMDKYEVTKAQWDEVYTWATGHGYSFFYAGSGKAANHPVTGLNWYNCVKWCNARSEMEGRTPCYYLDAAQTVVYRSGESNIWNEAVKWSANGYRLPTEAEWEKAARGGLAGLRFPWNDLNITHTNANYYSSSDYAYDTSTTRGYHPTFAVGDSTYTSPVGYFTVNGYGLYDMAGNVREWCWDWYDQNWYSNGGATQDDTRGPASGANRVLRGGSWNSFARSCRSAGRDYDNPLHDWNDLGFRLVLPAGQ